MISLAYLTSEHSMVLERDDRSPKVSRMSRQSLKMKLRLNLRASAKLGPNGLHKIETSGIGGTIKQEARAHGNLMLSAFSFIILISISPNLSSTSPSMITPFL